MIKIHGSKKVVEWYRYVYKHGADKRVHIRGGIPSIDGLPFVVANDKSFRQVQKMSRYNTSQLRECLFRLLTIGDITINDKGNFVALTDCCSDTRARIHSYIFNHDIKAIGKEKFIKEYMS